MVIDTSAVIAILRKESGFEAYLSRITEAEEVYISAVNLLECYLVLAASSERVKLFFEQAGIEVKNFTGTTASFARLAFLHYGKGRHPAALNICDCAAYATAKEYRLPLLYKGNDFNQTDIESALP